MRGPKVHESKISGFTDHADNWMCLTNAYMKKNPNSSLKQMTEYFIKKVGVSLSASSLRRYYYGVHHVNNVGRGHIPYSRMRLSYSRMRLGACVNI